MIELIVILGILAAVSLPTFINMRGEATDSALPRASAMRLNYGGCSATNNAVSADKRVQISACSQVGH